MHQLGRLSERGGNFLNFLQKERVTQKGGGEGPTLEGTMHCVIFFPNTVPWPVYHDLIFIQLALVEFLHTHAVVENNIQICCE